MTDLLDHARDVLLLGGYDLTEVRDLPTGHGWQLRCNGGEVICVYRSGKVVPQGKGAGAVKALFDARPLPTPKPVAKPKAAAPPEKTGAAPESKALVPRRPPGWTEEPWDGVTAPF